MGIGEESGEQDVAKYPSVTALIGIQMDPGGAPMGTVVTRSVSVGQAEPGYERVCALTRGTKVWLQLDGSAGDGRMDVLAEPNILLGSLEPSQLDLIEFDILTTRAAYEGEIVEVLRRDSRCEVYFQVMRHPRKQTSDSQ